MKKSLNKPYKILVIDDNKSINNIIQKILIELGYETHGVYYGKDAINWAKENKDFIILLDYMLPDMYGKEVIENLNKLNEKVYFIILTGYGDEKTAVEMMKKGALDYIVKEENFIEFIPALIERAIIKINQEKKIEAIESKLKIQNELLNNITSNLPNYIYWKDIDLKYLGCNKNFAKLFNLKNNTEIIGKTDYDLELKKSDLESMLKFDKEVLETGNTLVDIEEIYIKELNSKIALLTNRIPIKNNKGIITGVIFIGTDTSELKEIDEAVRTSETQYKELFSNMSSGVAVFSVINNGEYFNLIDLNQAGQRIDNLNKNNIIKKNILEIYPNSKKSGLYELIQKVYLTGQPEQQYIAEEKNNKICFKDVYIYKLPIENIVVVYDDITEKKQNQELLEEYKLAIESSKDIIAAVNKDYKYIFVNQEFLKYHKLKKENIVGKHIEEIMGKESFINIIKPNLDACFKGEIKKFEMNIEYYKQGLRTVLINYYPLKIDITKKENKGVVAIIRDITEQKLSENKLKEQYNFIQLLLDTVPTPIFYKDKNGKYIDCNKSFENILRQNKKNIIGKTLNQIINKEEAIIHNKSDQELLKDPGSKIYESTYFDKDNNIRDAIFNKATFNDLDGNPVGIIGSITDITELKKTEEILREEEQKIRSIFNSSPNAILVFDIDLNIIDCNAKTLEMFRIQNKNNIIGKNAAKFIIKKDRNKIFETVENVKSTGIINKNEITLIKQNGIEFIGEISFSLIRNALDEPLHYVAIIIDITNRTVFETQQKFLINILQLLNKKEKGINIIKEIIILIKKFTNIEAVGIRLKENDDFPYYEINGLPKNFIENDNSLCKKKKNGKLIVDKNNKPILHCICGNLISKKKDLKSKFYTKNGSFWTNSLNEILLTTNELENQALFLNCCQKEGYESIAIIPLLSDKEIIGLMQLNDKRKDMFSLDVIEFFENIGESIGIALDRIKSEEILSQREAEISSIFKASPVGIGVTKNKIITQINDKFCNIVGYKKEELIGNSSRLVYPSDEEYELVEKINYEQIKLNGTGTVETKFKKKDGNVIDILLSSTSLNPNDITNGLTFTALDITDRKLAVEALKESERRFKELFNNMSSGVAIYTPVDNGNDFIIKDFNKSSEKIENIKKEQVIGKSVQKIFPGVKNFGLFDVFQRVYKTGKPEFFPVNLYKDNRIISWRENYVYKLQSDEIVAVYDDVSKRKQAENELKKLNEELEERVLNRTQQLEEANNELESFAYSVSHDLRAPLRHIYGFTELLMKEINKQLQDKEKKYLNNIINSAKNMSQLINDLLQFSRLGRNKLNYSLIDFKLLIEDSKNVLSNEIKNRKIIWIIKKLPKINCDLSMMRQVIINLISNAVKYTKKRKEAVIEIGTIVKNKKEIIFYIKDNGIGFNMEYLSKLYGVFQRLHSDKDFEGTGIGLAIVKRIIIRHGGNVWAEGKINKGATFYFSLPI